MDLGYAIDTTPVSSPPFFQEYRDRGETPLGDRSSFGIVQTDPFVYRSISIERSVEGWLTGSGQGLASRYGHHVDDESHEDTAVVSARDARLALLVKKYESERFSREDDARLEMLTRRLRRLSPRVTAADLDRLDAVVEKLEEISSDIDSLRNEFGV